MVSRLKGIKLKAGRVALYTCEDCGKPVTATPDNPLVWTSRGKHCAACNSKHASDPTPDTARVERHEAASKSRGEAASARWAAKTPEEKAAHVAKMQAARKAAREAARAAP